MICKQPPDSPYVRGAFPVLRDGGDDDDDDDVNDDFLVKKVWLSYSLRHVLAHSSAVGGRRVVVVVVVAKHTWKRRQLEYEQR